MTFFNNIQKVFICLVALSVILILSVVMRSKQFKSQTTIVTVGSPDTTPKYITTTTTTTDYLSHHASQTQVIKT